MDAFEKTCGEIASETIFSTRTVLNAASLMRGKVSDEKVLKLTRDLCHSLMLHAVAGGAYLAPDTVILCLLGAQSAVPSLPLQHRHSR
jgi:hypothetical protein